MRRTLSHPPEVGLLSVFLRSAGLHAIWLVRSFFPGAHRGAPLSLRRALLLAVLAPPFLLVQAVHWLGLLLDEILFRGYRRMEVRAPVFISGVPRSGTTFVHRTLAAADDRFTTVSTWEAALAPSVSERKVLRAVAAVDRRFGGHLRRTADAALRRVAGDLDDIHPVDLAAAEEDYLWLLPAASCFIVVLAFPFSGWLRSLVRFDTLPEERRRGVLRYYRRCIQKHLYCASPRGRRFLSKNASFGTWTESLRGLFPDAEVVLCVREPDEAVSSQLSSLENARRVLGVEGSWLEEEVVDFYTHNYETLAGLLGDGTAEDPGPLVVVLQEDLQEDPAATMGALVDELELPPSPGLRAALEALPSRRHRSAHDHDSAAVEERPGRGSRAWTAYERLAASAGRVRVEAVAS